MKKIIFVCLTALFFAGCSTNLNHVAESTADACKARMAASYAQAKTAECERAKIEQREAEANRALEVEKARIKADADKKIAEDRRLKAESEQKIAEENRRKAEEDRKKMEVQLECERNARLNKLFSSFGSVTPDFKSELAIGERFFNDANRNSSTVRSSRLLGEYVWLMRILSNGGKIPDEKYKDVMAGSILVGRMDVTAWAYKTLKTVDAKSEFDGRVPILLALAGIDDKVLDFVWNAHPKLANVVDENGDTPLHYAISRGSMRDVKLALAEKSLIDVRNRRGENAMYTAMSFNRSDIVKVLIEDGANLTGAMGSACRFGNMDVIRLLEAKKVEPTIKDMKVAMERDHLEVVKWLVEKKLFNVNDPALDKPAQVGPVVRQYLILRGAVNLPESRSPDGK